jgi:pimeloyl-ACP methyl ester carboxylesterase
MLLRRTSPLVRISSVAAALAVIASLSLGPSAGASSGVSGVGAASATSAIDWQPCHGSFFCAKVRVPLDYDRPDGRQITLALAMMPATDKAHRVGSLFINPGGPGGSGVDFLLGAGPFLFTPDVRARFDIIGFDPRGIIRSTPMTCYPTLEQSFAAFQSVPYPTTVAEQQNWVDVEHSLDSSCRLRGGDMLDHMSTADVARDLDQLRQMVGDSGLSYYGVSYGSFLGNVYANMFPDKVRAVVIDGVLDPVAWTTGSGDGTTVPFSTRLHSAVGAQATLEQFFSLCDAAGRPRCSFAPHAKRTFDAMYASLRDHPLTPNPDGADTPYDESWLLGDILGFLYDSPSWGGLADLLTEIETWVNRPATAVAPSTKRPALSNYPNFVEGFPGVACSDSVNPPTYAAWPRAAASSLQTDGIFGPLWTWVSSICADWPGADSDRYLGPFTHRTAEPVLVVGNLWDPATPYQGAVKAASLLPNSRLLTVHGWGHTSLFLSACADRAIGRYLLTTNTPASGTVCNQDAVPFTGSSSVGGLSKSVLPVAPARPHWLAAG